MDILLVAYFNSTLKTFLTIREACEILEYVLLFDTIFATSYASLLESDRFFFRLMVAMFCFWLLYRNYCENSVFEHIAVMHRIDMFNFA